ncbi:anti-repressor SinI family protein [Gracilibacillus massiliensis]|nr:anti-repressor SinI family protein [Gracilibacillus massiliensis]
MKTKQNVDYEWIYLMAKAKEKGYSADEVRAYLDKNKLKECVK